MTTSIFYKNRQFNGEFISKFKGEFSIYIDRIAQRAILVDKSHKVVSILKVETYQMDALLDNECKEYADELKYLERRFEEDEEEY